MTQSSARPRGARYQKHRRFFIQGAVPVCAYCRHAVRQPAADYGEIEHRRSYAEDPGQFWHHSNWLLVHGSKKARSRLGWVDKTCAECGLDCNRAARYAPRDSRNRPAVPFTPEFIEQARKNQGAAGGKSPGQPETAPESPGTPRRRLVTPFTSRDHKWPGREW